MVAQLHEEVLEVYRITLLSNDTPRLLSVLPVLEVYRITLLSNKVEEELTRMRVLEVYRITLLSNTTISTSKW